MIIVFAIAFAAVAFAYFWKKGKTASKSSSAQKNLSYSSGESSTVDETPKPEGLDLDDAFEGNESETGRTPSPTSSLKLGDPGFAQSADQSDENGSSADVEPDNPITWALSSTGHVIMWALSFVKG